MAISYVGSANGETGNLTLSGVQEGDVCFLWLYRDSSTNGFPNGTTEWPALTGAPNNFQIGRLYAHVVTAGEGSAGSATSDLSWGGMSLPTTGVLLAYRGASGWGVFGSTGAASSTVTYPALSLTVTDGTSWVVAFAGHRSVNTSLQTAPSGLTNRINMLDATDHVVVHDGARSSWSATDVSVGGTSSGWRAATIELVAATGGGPPSETGSGSLTTTSLTAPSGASTATTPASGSFAVLSLSAPTGTSSTFVSVTATGAISALTLSAPAAAAATVSVASGALDALALTAPTGASATASEISASGSLAPLSLSAPVGSTAVISSVTGTFAQISLAAPTGTASTVTETLAVGPVSELNLSAPFGFVTTTGLAAGSFAAIALSAITAKSGTDALDDLVYQLLANRQELDPVLGEFIVYDVDGVTIKWRAKAWEDANATQPYRGGALRRIDKLELL